MITLKMLLITTVFIIIINLILRLFHFKIKRTHTITSLSLAIMFIGGILSALQESDVKYYYSIKNWPGTNARITETKITGKFAVLPEICYQYTLNDSSYSGKTNLDIPGFGNRKKRDQTARIILRDYPPGKEVAIVYNPDQPSISRIKISPPWNVYGRMGFGVFLFGCGCFMFLFFLFQKSIQ